MKYKEYLSVAVPFIISTVTQPLLGAVDTSVIGHLNNPSYIGSVAIGAVIFNTLYWVFGFLRVSTSGFSAQSLGSKSKDDSYLSYFRPLIVALIISFLFIILQNFILKLGIKIYNPEPHVMKNVELYFNILIWGAPFVLIGYVNLGWIMGRRLIKETLFLQISTNLINILLDILFVMKFNMKIEGVAYATLISQISGFIFGFFIISKKLDFKKITKYKTQLTNTGSIKNIMKVNSDLIIRTVCLLVMTNMFIAKGNRFGVELLAANAILFQIQYIISYMYDGLANASSIFTGKAVGEKNITEYKSVIKVSNVFIVIFSIIIALIIFLFQNNILKLFTNMDHIIEISKDYIPWLIIFPFVAGVGLVYYGIFSGAVYTVPIRNSMVLSFILFFIVYLLAVPKYQNHGLWLSFIIFSFGRSFFLYIYKNKLTSKFLC